MVTVRIVTVDEMVLVVKAASIWEAVRKAREEGYQVAIAIEVTQ